MYRAQAGQDRWVAEHVYPGRRDGYFVEVGASHGPHGEGSNSWTLERELGWTGILVEADPVNAANLRALRRARVCPVAAYDRDGDTVELVLAGAYSGTIPDVGKDAWGAMRAGKLRVTVETRRLGTILAAAGAPPLIDFLSVDTEGSELRILRGLFTAEAPTEHTFGAICVEHNFVADDRRAIRALLGGKGYLLAGAHGVDDYFVHPSVAGGRDLDPAKLLPPLSERQQWVCQALEEYDRRRRGGDAAK